jgi:hypothetical protein
VTLAPVIIASLAALLGILWAAADGALLTLEPPRRMFAPDSVTFMSRSR